MYHDVFHIREIPLLVLISGRYVPSVKRIWMPLAFFAVAAPVLHRLNTLKGSNFMFLNRPSAGSPFELVYYAHGYAAYLAVFISVVFGIILLMYAGIAAVRGLAEK